MITSGCRAAPDARLPLRGELSVADFERRGRSGRLTLLGATFDFAKELGELLGRLIGRALAFGLHEILHERSPDPLVDL